MASMRAQCYLLWIGFYDMKGFRSINLQDAQLGTIKLLVALPQENESWGILAPLRGTLWGNQIAIVSGENISHALHGWAMPLMKEIGTHPHVRAMRVPIHCDLKGACVGFRSKDCLPGLKTPDCYQTANGELASIIVAAWKEGRYVIVVQGSEFSLL